MPANSSSCKRTFETSPGCETVFKSLLPLVDPAYSAVSVEPSRTVFWHQGPLQDRLRLRISSEGYTGYLKPPHTHS